MKDMHVVITGVLGFLGRALATQLIEAGASVSGIDSVESHAARVTLPSVVTYRQADIRVVNQLQAALEGCVSGDPADVVMVHLAAQSHVGTCQAEPLSACEVNVMGTANVLEACRQRGVTRVVFPSTALVYARPARQPIAESDPLDPNSVYAATKRACEVLIATYASNYRMSCRIARLGNVYGPSAPGDSVVDLVLRQVKTPGPMRLKTLSPIRDFVYRDDVIQGLIALAQRTGEPGCECFNLSSGTPTSIRELALTACRVADVEPRLIETGPEATDQADRVVLSIARLSEYGPWRPTWSLEDGLRQTLSERGVTGNA